MNRGAVDIPQGRGWIVDTQRGPAEGQGLNITGCLLEPVSNMSNINRPDVLILERLDTTRVLAEATPEWLVKTTPTTPT
jgi:hypothetical protein